MTFDGETKELDALEAARAPHLDAAEKVEPFWVKHQTHLQILWNDVYRSTILFVSVFVIAFFFAAPILDVFVRAFTLRNVTLVTTRPFQFVDLSADIAYFFSFLFTVPYFVWRLYRFIRPAFAVHEMRATLAWVTLSIALFLAGFSYGFFSLFWGLQVLANLNTAIGLTNYWDIGPFIDGIMLTATLLGVLFELPIILTFLIRMNILDVDMLIRHRRIAWAVVFIIVSLLPPSDVISLILMSTPMILLYESAILMNR